MNSTAIASDVGSAGSLGVIAGAGELPRMIVRNAKQSGLRVCVVGLRGSAESDLAQWADSFRWAGVTRMGSWIRAFRRDGCREIVMAGRVRKAKMFAMPRWLQWLRYLPDLTSIRVWYFHARDKRNDTLLGAVADELARKGLTLIDSTRYCPEALAKQGRIGAVEPGRGVAGDLDFAWPLCKRIAELDIGQAVAVKEREIIAVEAIEGTDKLIERAGQLCPVGGWSLVKVAKPNQDMRFDVPTIGPLTIENLHKAGGGCIVVEAGKTIILEREKTVALANKHNIAIIGRRDGDADERTGS
jgi:DUF1009 family protein